MEHAPLLAKVFVCLPLIVVISIICISLGDWLQEYFRTKKVRSM
jgi:hypothetical protein